jgi:hypothetical protein
MLGGVAHAVDLLLHLAKALVMGVVPEREGALRSKPRARPANQPVDVGAERHAVAAHRLDAIEVVLGESLRGAGAIIGHVGTHELRAGEGVLEGEGFAVLVADAHKPPS